jgi:hypothetical protein
MLEIVLMLGLITIAISIRMLNVAQTPDAANRWLVTLTLGTLFMLVAARAHL